MKCSMMIYERCSYHLTNLLVFRAGPDGQGGNSSVALRLWVVGGCGCVLRCDSTSTGAAI